MTTKIKIFEGKVGIGTDDPGSDDLFVNGTIKTNSLSIGGITNSHVPQGIICMWSGAIIDIPLGWGLCDGTTYGSIESPDLTSKFIKGAGGISPAPGDIGGSATITLGEANVAAHAHGASSSQVTHNNHTLGVQNAGAHNHPMTNSGNHTHPTTDPYHSHTVYGGRYLSNQVQYTARELNNYHYAASNATSEGVSVTGIQTQGQQGAHTHTSSAAWDHNHGTDTSEGGEHHHQGLTVGNAGSGSAFDSEPEYYVLAWIIKI